MKALFTAAMTALFLLALPLSADASKDGHDEGAHHEAHPVPGAPHVNWTNFFGYKDVNEKGEKLEADEAHMSPPLVFQMINFAIFAGLLVLLAGPRIKKAMVRRHDEVNTALQEAAVLKAEASKKLEEYSKRIADVDREVDDLVKTIRHDAEEERARLTAEAEASAATLKRDAENRIAASIDRARAGLEAEVIAAAIEAAEGVIASSVNEADHNNLVERFIASFDAPPAPKNPPTGGSGGSGGGDATPAAAPEPREKRDSAVDEGWD